MERTLYRQTKKSKPPCTLGRGRRPSMKPKKDIDIWDILIDATMRVTIRTLLENNEEIDKGKLVNAIRQEVRGAIPRLMDEWSDMLEVNLNELWLRRAVNIQAHELAAQSIQVYHERKGKDD
jgi:hypothetical protein